MDLIGLQVGNREGVVLGQVRELMSTGPQTVLVLGLRAGRAKTIERMIPFVDAYIDKCGSGGQNASPPTGNLDY